MPKRFDLTEKTFGRLHVTGLLGSAPDKQLLWHCVCRCGEELAVPSRSLRSGNTRSCGCLRREVAPTTRLKHGAWAGGKPTPEYRAWRCMLNRCYRKKDLSYKWYGKLGVLVYEPWVTSFEKFLKYVGPKPSPKHSLDRYPDPAGDYQPGNVRWATASQQRTNRRA